VTAEMPIAEPNRVAVVSSPPASPCSVVPEVQTVKNRPHLDLHPSESRRDEEVARLEGLGASVLRRVKEQGGEWVLMADPEGNELCVQ
jgi:hypothetical protein